MIAAILRAALGDARASPPRATSTTTSACRSRCCACARAHRAARDRARHEPPGRDRAARAHRAAHRRARQQRAARAPGIHGDASRRWRARTALRSRPARTGGIAVFPADDASRRLWHAARRRARARSPSRSRQRRPTSAAAPNGATVAAHAACTRRPARRAAPRMSPARHNVAQRAGRRGRALAAGCPLDAIVRGLEAFAPVQGRSRRRRSSAAAGAHADRRQLQRQPGLRARRHRRAGRRCRRRAGWCSATWARSATRARPSTPRSAPTRGARHRRAAGAPARSAPMRRAAFGSGARHFADVAALLAALRARRRRAQRCWSRARAS